MIAKTWKILEFNTTVEIFLNSQQSVIVKNYNCICEFFCKFFLKTLGGFVFNPNLWTSLGANINMNVDVNTNHYVDIVT